MTTAIERHGEGNASPRPVPWSVVAFGGTAVFTLGFSILVLGLAPAGGWRDITEFQWAAAVLGIPHPPGSPVPALLGRLVTLVPVGSIAWRVNLLSAFSGALALALAYCLAVEVLGAVRPRIRPWVLGCAALGSPIVLLGSPVFREHAATAEVYALQAALAALLAWQWIRVTQVRGRADVRPLASLALLGALGAGVHVSFAFYLAALVAWFAVRDRAWVGPRVASVVASVVVVGGTVFAYVPLRAATHPSINWGDAVTLDRLRYHLTDQKDWEKHDDGKATENTLGRASAAPGAAAAPSPGLAERAGRKVRALGASVSTWCGFLSRYLQGEMGAVTRALAALGFVLAAVNAPRVAGVVAALIAAHLAFAIPIGKWANPTGYNPVYLLVSVLSCVPLGWLAGHAAVRARAAAAGALVVVMLAPPALRVADAWSGLDALADDFRADDLTREMMRPLRPNTILLAAHLWPLFGYLREVEGYRTDIDVVFRNEIYETQRMRLDPTRVSAIVIPGGDAPLEGRAARVLRMRAFLELNHRAGRPLAWQSEADDLYFRVRPTGLLFDYAPGGGDADPLVAAPGTTDALDRWLTSFEPGGSRRGWLRELDDFEEAILPVARYAGWQAARLECDEATRWWQRAREVLGAAESGIPWTGGLAEMVRLCPAQRASRDDARAAPQGGDSPSSASPSSAAGE